MKTAVVILNWNTRDLLGRFLPGLVHSCEGLDAEVIVADSASTDGSMELVKERFPDIRRIQLDANYGFTGGYDRALDGLDAEYYVLINSDVEVSDGWLEPLVGWMDTHPDCGACAPKLHSWYERDKFEYAGAAGGLMDKFGYTFCRGRVMKRLETDHGQYDGPADVLWATGACLMVRRSVWEQFGGLDERFFAHMEEIDLCWRMQLEGWKVQVVPQSLVYHLGGGTLPAQSPWKLKLNFRNNLLMLENNLARTYALRYGDADKALRRSRLTIFVRKLLDGCSAAVYLLTGRTAFVKAVLDAHREYGRMRRTVTAQELNEYLERWSGKAAVAGIWQGSIVLQSILKKDGIFDYLRRQKYSGI